MKKARLNYLELPPRPSPILTYISPNGREKRERKTPLGPGPSHFIVSFWQLLNIGNRSVHNGSLSHTNLLLSMGRYSSKLRNERLTPEGTMNRISGLTVLW